MKHLSALLFTATALALSGGSTANAQLLTGVSDDVIVVSKGSQRPADSEARDEAKTGAKTPATVPLPEAKRNYQEKERQLRDLAEGKTDVLRLDVERITDQRFAPLGEVFVDQRKLDQVRQAVTEAYDARQQLQAAELAELERRIASIKRAMALRETMKESIIDQRTEELLEQMEAAKNQPDQKPPKQQQQGGVPRNPGSQAQTPGYPGPAGKAPVDPFGTATGSADDPHIGPEARRRLLELDVQEAEATLAAAERAYKRGKALFDTGPMSEDAYDKLSEEVERAKIQLERAKVKQRAQEQSSAASAEEELSAAKLNFKSAEQQYNYAESMHEKGYVTQDDVELKSETLNAARARLKHAQANSEAVRKPSGSEDDSLKDNASSPFHNLNRPNAADPNSTEDAPRGASARKRLLEHDVENAAAKLDAAQRDYDRVKALYDTGAVEQSVLDQKGKDHEVAKIQLERAKVKLGAARHRSRQDGRSSNKETAEAFLANQRLAQLDVDEAEAHLGATELQYERCKRLYDSNSIQKSVLDEQADKYHRAQKQLERARVKLKALSPATSAVDGAQGKEVAAAHEKNSLTITLIETGEGKPAAVYLADGKVGEPLPGTPEDQDDQIRQAVAQGVGAGKSSVVIKAEKGVAHRDVLRVSAAAGSVEGVSLHLAVAKDGIDGEHKNAP